MIEFSGRIPIKVSPYFFLVAGVIGWLYTFNITHTLLWIIVIAVSVLLHEFGHALTARAFGQQPRIELIPFGGATHREGPQLKLWQEFLVILNGPAMGLATFVVAFQALKVLGNNANAVVLYMVEVAMFVNLFWSVVNLLPILPLDGGKLLSIGLEAMFGLRGVKASMLISVVISTSIALLFFVYGNMLLGALFFLLAFEGFRSWRRSLEMTASDRDQKLQELLKRAQDNYRHSNREAAINQLTEIRRDAKEGIVYQSATQLLAVIYAKGGNRDEAFHLLLPLKDSLDADALCMLHSLAYKTGHHEVATTIGDRVYQIDPTYHTALINALSFALMEKVKPALGWLQCALREGLPNIREMLAKGDFDKIRQLDEFRRFEASVGKTSG